MQWSTLLITVFVAVCLGDEIKRVAQERLKLPPSIQWQFPEDFFVFYKGDAHLVSFVVHNFWTPAAGMVTLIVNGNKAAEWNSPPNEFGETRLHVSLPEFPDGFHEVAVVLVDSEGEPIDVEASVAFEVKSQEDRPIGKAETWDFCKNAGVCRDDQGCSGHGRCINGACVCDPHWTGERCDFDLFLLPRYHPQPDPQLSPSRCEKARQWENGTRDLIDALERVNFPQECTPSTVMLFEAPSHGLGANMHYLTVAMTRGLQQGRAMVLRPPPHMPVWLYGWHAECKVKGHGCHFEPWTNCTGNETDVIDAYVHPRNGESFPPDSRWRPNDLLHQGTLWYRSLIMHWLLRPNADLEAKIRAKRNELQIVHPIIGMHIRAGDACAHAATSTLRPECRPIEAYVNELQKMAAAYNVTRVFLACDDQFSAEVIASQANLQVVMLPMDRSMFDGKWFIEYRMAYGATNTAQVAESTMIDLFLLRECDYFVGTFASQFSRLAFEMMVAYKGYVPPYASVDYPWCFNYMERMQLGNFGVNFC